MANSFTGLSEKQIEDLVSNVFDGIVTPMNLPPELYAVIMLKIQEGITNGFGGGLLDFDDLSPEKELIEFFTYNTQIFSAAKTFQQVNDMSLAIFDAEGFKRSFADFEKDAAKIFGIYNEVWLQAEFETATNMGFSARSWMDIQRDAEATPMLEYETVGDERVRPQHVSLDAIVKPVDSPFWNTHFPPNGWRCRCIVRQRESGEVSVTPNGKLPAPSEIPPLFRMNPGKDKFIFDPDKHPYFNVEQQFEQHKANNFGLPSTGKPQPLPDQLRDDQLSGGGNG